jgi:alcohol dehydrogenase (cytochrome c)
VAWSYPTGTREQFEVSPVVYAGVMYISTSYNRVMALDARTGEMLWRYDHPQPLELRACCGPVNRGVAISGDAVLMATLDARLIALDRRTGAILWNTVVIDYTKGYSATSVPLIVGDRAIIGVAGGEFGIRGFFDAYDLETGELLWRHDTIPAAGEPGVESWEGRSYETGGAPAWTQGAYDVETDTLFWTTGNPAPDFNGDLRGGDNLFSNSVLAVDPATGERKWSFQFTPHDVWDKAKVACSTRPFDDSSTGESPARQRSSRFRVRKRLIACCGWVLHQAASGNTRTLRYMRITRSVRCPCVQPVRRMAQ